MILTPATLRVCSHKAKSCAVKAGTKAHYVYLIAATLADSNIVLRCATGGCLVFCVLAEVLKDHEEGTL